MNDNRDGWVERPLKVPIKLWARKAWAISTVADDSELTAWSLGAELPEAEVKISTLLRLQAPQHGSHWTWLRLKTDDSEETVDDRLCKQQLELS